MTASLDVVAVQTALAATRFAGPIHDLPVTESTNALALAAAAAGARSGVWVAAQQSAGRGRGGHTWHSPAGAGLYVSILAAPALAARNALAISLATGLAAQEAIATTTGLTVDLRWPNDLMLAGRKCGGILVETATNPVRDTAPATLRFAVIGVGINIAHAAFPPELEAIATSLHLAGGRPVTRESLLIALLHALSRELTALEHDAALADPALRGERESPALLERFAGRSSWVHGKRVLVDDRDLGTTDGLTPEGFLRVVHDDGTVQVVRSGGVREPAAPAPDSPPVHRV